MKQVQAQSKLKEILIAKCGELKRRFYEIKIATTDEGDFRLICDSKLDDIYLKFGEERIRAVKPLNVLSRAYLKIINGKK